MNYQIQGLSIHAEVHGTAEPALVFLHYGGGTSRTWRKVIWGNKRAFIRAWFARDPHRSVK
jgi:hypothetical protein